jgi:hypothetical protein
MWPVCPLIESRHASGSSQNPLGVRSSFIEGNENSAWPLMRVYFDWTQKNANGAGTSVWLGEASI